MVLTAIPFLISYYEFSKLPHVPQIISRMGIQVKQISFLKIFVLFQVAGYIFLGWLIVKEKDRRFYFFISLLISPVVCYWGIPFAAGYGIQIFHWSLTALDPFIIIYLAYLFASIQESQYRSPWINKIAYPFIQYQKGIAIGLIIFFFTFGFYTHIRFSFKTHDIFYISKALQKSFDWLNNNAEKDAVVVSDSMLTINLLPTYTHCNNFVPNSYLCTSSTDEIIHRLAIAYLLFQVPQEHLEMALSANNVVTDPIKKYIND